MEEDSPCFDAPLRCVVPLDLQRSLLQELEIKLALLLFTISHDFITERASEISTRHRAQAAYSFTIHCSLRKLYTRRNSGACFNSGRKIQPISTLRRRSKKWSPNEEGQSSQTAVHGKRTRGERKRAGSGICIRRDSSIPLLQWNLRCCCAQLRLLIAEHQRQKENQKRESSGQALLQATVVR